ncbi:MAG: DEAD/DEAH box helicase [Planctomycetes bacterium]|nr:DEAD/DEAH box helicase [Planctomycetota bacterium]
MPLSGFHPIVRRWFEARFAGPTAPQREGWPAIRSGRHTLIAAPTGSGKTLAAFLWGIDRLLSEGQALPERTQVLYVSPLKALSNDIQKNLQGPLAELAALDPALPQVRVLVRTGDTRAGERTAMSRRPPHILVTTPESLYILLTSDGGRRLLAGVRTVIVDEVHAVARDKRGAHLALSLERLEALAGPVQRIGLSATQRPIEETARLLVGVGRECSVIDVGHLRELDIAVEVPPSPLTAVCSHEVWEEIYARLATLIREHRTTLVFVNTRKMAERLAARLSRLLGEDQVTCHHGSLSRARRLDAEQRLKEGRLRALVATASLELGIDVGDMDLAIQIGSARSIATFLQRVGRAGHSLSRVPKGRIFPLTLDELVECAALLRAVRRGDLDRTVQARRPLDILAQQLVAACVPEAWPADALYQLARRAWPYRDLARADFDAVVALHAEGRRALLHRDGVGGRLLATRRARLAAITSGGAIPDTADYQVLLEPDGTHVGSLNEDFAVEANVHDVVQLGNTSWRILRIEPGVVRVADAKGQPPTLPFWLGEAPARTAELSAEVARLREELGADPTRLADTPGISEAAARELAEYVGAGRTALGVVPSQTCVVLERFFDESGGTQVVLHSPFGARVNRAWGLALRKRFCRGFGFELQAAANEDAIVFSLGPQTGFPLEEVFRYLTPENAEGTLQQALLASPLFTTRWRWNVTRSLLVERMRSGRRVAAPLLRFRADDLLAAAFPGALACPETLPGGDIEIPMEHPIVRQTLEDCFQEATDFEGLLVLLRGLREGRIRTVAVDVPEPSAFARGILAAHPYSFLDDAPLEERRTQAVLARRTLDARATGDVGALDPEAIRRVREEAWPRPANAEEVHEALLWMGYATEAEAAPWRTWLAELAAAGRVRLEWDRWFAAEATREAKEVLRGRLEALGPVYGDDPIYRELEREGVVLRGRFEEGREGWCDRRLLARIHRYTIERLRNEIAPVTAAEFLRFLGLWQHVEPSHRLDGPRGVAEVVGQLAGFEVPAAAWEAFVLPARVRGYRREWLDQATLSGEVAWGRVWSGGSGAVRTAPLCLLPRADLETWLGLAPPVDLAGVSGAARDVHAALGARGAAFTADLARASKLLPAHLEMGLSELVARGALTCDSFAALRQLVVPPSRRRAPFAAAGRWSLFRAESPAEKGQGGSAPPNAMPSPTLAPAPVVEFVARQLLRRTGVVFRKTIARERQPIPWRELVRAYRMLELRGEVRGGRFVAGFDGEQYALPEAVPLLRAVRRGEPQQVPLRVAAADPLNFRGILTPDPRVPATAHGQVEVAGAAGGTKPRP